MAKSKVPAAILHFPIPEVRRLALVRWEACERCEDFVRVVLALLDKFRIAKSISDAGADADANELLRADANELLRSFRELLRSAICEASLSGQDLGFILDFLSGLDLIQAAVDVTPAGGKVQDFIDPKAWEAAVAKIMKFRQLIAPTPEPAQLTSPAPEHGQLTSPLPELTPPKPALDSPAVQKALLREIAAGFPVIRKAMAEFTARAHATKTELITICSRPLAAAGAPSKERASTSSAALGDLSEAERRIIEVIRHAGHRMTTDEIVSELERQHGAASLGTTKNALAGLRRRKILTNRQDVKPKGYGLAEWEKANPS